ncbi:peptide deformylase [Chitinophaga horti]|uniref:Peptide deformylase n=1 Tax=Chitinophaga horti TaxID=2920382 RepID=A0ABY6J7V7_9BACT|nr:peptide deformylase [Chitinophaga horti]UYQ95778.1 peptide deformylase [Chitinophaga horti]
MKRAIFAYGHSILKQSCNDIDPSYPGLNTLIADMWETMKNANGCGLAASQIGVPIRLFVVSNQEEEFRETFINARIIARSPELWDEEEGCLSIPGLSQMITRNWAITIAYFNERFERQTRTFSGATARMIQHEYDHTAGVLFLDYLKPLTKKLIAAKLKRIMEGKVRPGYLMRFV